MHHAHRHALTRTRERRQQLAFEAARLMAEQGVRDFALAKRKAAQRLGIHDDSAMPRNNEIEQALRDYQRLFQAQSQPQALQQRRLAAVEAMRFLARFEPRLVGAVLDGTGDAHSAVCLQLFADDADAVRHFLDEHGIRYESSERRLRLDREREARFPVLLFAAGEVPFDLTLLPRDALRQAPLDRISEKPMRRATLAAVESLLDEP